jgi:hypothetical protein
MPSRKSRKGTSQVHPLVGVQKKERKFRVCIRCDKKFLSRCSGNRTCGACKRGLGDARLPLTYRSELNDESD